MIACGNMAIRLTITVTTAPRKGSELAQLYKAPRTKRQRNQISQGSHSVYRRNDGANDQVA